MKKELEKMMITESPFNVEAIDSSEKMKTLKVLHLSGNTHHSMALWSRLANGSDVPVDLAIAASHKEVREVMGDYERIMVSSPSDLKKITYAGFDLEKASVMEIKTRINDRGIHEFHGDRNPVRTSYIEDLDDCAKKIILCFKNISTHDKNRGFEKMIAKFLKGVKRSGLKGEKLYEKTASKIMKKLKWRKT